MGLGFPGYITHFTSRRISNSYWLDHVGCSGNESSITKCSNNGWRNNDCTSNEGVYLECRPSGMIKQIHIYYIHTTSKVMSFRDTE